MTTTGASEPTNEELWAQPPTAPYQVPSVAEQAHLPVPQAPSTNLPMPVPGPAAVPGLTPARRSRSGLTLAITSLGVGIPLTAIAVSEAGLPGLIVAWVGIVGVNAAYASNHRH